MTTMLLFNEPSLLSLLMLLSGLMGGVAGDVTLTPPPACYSSCLSSELAAVGCSFANLSCYCGTSNTVFVGQLTGCVTVNCDSADAAAGASCPAPPTSLVSLFPRADNLVLSGACAVLTSGQTTLPASLATIIPSKTSSSSSSTATSAKAKTTDDPSKSTSTPTSSSTLTTMATITTTNSDGQTVATTVATTIVDALQPESTAIGIPNTNATSSSGASTGALIGGIVGGIVGFLILALLFMSVVLYVLVRRSVERRQAKRDGLFGAMDGKASPGSRSSVAASDQPEEEFDKMEPSFWGVVTRPKQALRVVNM